MSTPTAIRAGLKAALDPVALPDGFQVLEYQRSTPMPPTIHFFPEKKTYYVGKWQWCVQAFVGLGFEEAAQMTLDALLADTGATSIKAALELEPTLGGAVLDLVVLDNEGYQLFVSERQVVLGSTWTVEMAA